MSETDWSGVELCMSETMHDDARFHANRGRPNRSTVVSSQVEKKPVAKRGRKPKPADEPTETSRKEITNNYVLIDYENVQPTDLTVLYDGPFKVIVFIGANQTKISVTFAAAIQRFGANAEYVITEASGPNALDFHIAYYIGLLVAREPSAYYHIISKDTGYDPLIQHIAAKKIRIERCASVSQIDGCRPAAPAENEQYIDTILAHLGKAKDKKPRTRKTLLNTMSSLFKKQLSARQVSDLFDVLCEQGIIEIEGDRISYEMASEV